MAKRDLPPELSAALRLAWALAARLGHACVGTEHLLLALAMQPQGADGRLLHWAGLTGPEIAAAVLPPARARSTVGRSAAGADAGRAPRRFPRAERTGAASHRAAAGERLPLPCACWSTAASVRSSFYPTMRGASLPGRSEACRTQDCWINLAWICSSAPESGSRSSAGGREIGDRPADPLAAAQKQSRPHRRAGRRQDGHRGGRGAVSRRRDRAGVAARQAPLCAGHGQRHRRHKVPR